MFFLPSLTFAARVPGYEGRKGRAGEYTFDTACMQTAVEARDTAILAAFQVLAKAMEDAFRRRSDALKEAWGKTLSTERAAAIKAAWDSFRKSKKEASGEFKTTRKVAWKQFKDTAKGPCKLPVKPEPSGEGVDNSAL
jgi:hypothetical protein